MPCWTFGDATAAIVGAAGETHRTFQWVNEPRYWRWDFTREKDMVTVTIALVGERDEWTEDNGAAGIVRFEAHVSTRVLTAVVVGALDDVLRRYGSAEFDQDWSRPLSRVEQKFPYVAYARLRELQLRAGGSSPHLEPARNQMAGPTITDPKSPDELQPGDVVITTDMFEGGPSVTIRRIEKRRWIDGEVVWDVHPEPDGSVVWMLRASDVLQVRREHEVGDHPLGQSESCAPPDDGNHPQHG